MKALAGTLLWLAAGLLAGCDAGPASPDDWRLSAAVNPYPAGEAAPMFFRSPSQWQPYATGPSAEARRGD